MTGNIVLQNTIAKGFDDKWVKEIPYSNHHTYSIFVALSGPGHNTTKSGHIETLKQLNAIIAAFPDFAFYIKLHSKDNKAYYHQIAKHSHVYFTDDLQSKPDALHILSKSDMLITGASTVALDALQMGIPVVSIDPLQELNHFAFLNHHQVFKTNTAPNDEEMKHRILRILTDKSIQIAGLPNSGAETIVATIASHLKLNT
jgi:predicted glycosyltransferase